jgi:cytochrome c-type biogenesis protein CcmE
LPCQALWSINESYSRTDLAIVTVIVAVMTYLITLNLNNLARALGKVYGPKRRSLIEQMSQDGNWVYLGGRFKMFQRLEKGQQVKPSEWMIVVFLLYRMMAGLSNALSMTKAKVRESVMWFMRPTTTRSGELSDSI